MVWRRLRVFFLLARKHSPSSDKILLHFFFEKKKKKAQNMGIVGEVKEETQEIINKQW